MWWVVQVCLYGAILGLSRTYSTSSRSCRAHIGFTAVKKRLNPIFHSACTCEFRTTSFLFQAQETTNVRARIFSHILLKFWEFAIHISSFPFSLHKMSLYIDMKMILPWNCSGSHLSSAIIFWISPRIPNAVNPGNFSTRIPSAPLNSIQILETACFQIPFNFVSPSLDWCNTNASQTKHRVSKDVGLGFHNTNSFITQ